MNLPVNLKLAKLLKEKDCDLNHEYMVFTLVETEQYPEGEIFLKPTIAEVCMWLYEKHGIWISVLQMLNNGVTVTWYASYYEQGVGEDIEVYYNSPTEAYEAAIEYTLNNLL